MTNRALRSHDASGAEIDAGELEAGTTFGTLGDDHVPFVVVSDGVDDGETEARPGSMGRVAPLEDSVMIRFGNTGTVVPDGESLWC
jgi:hypothetical protein